MGAQTVRNAIAAYLGSPMIPGLLSMFRGVPTIVQGDDWSPQIATGWGAAAALHLEDKREKRIAINGATDGVKEVTYTVALIVAFRWVIPEDAAEYDGEPDGWTDAFDGLMDAIEDRMRADRTFGCGDAGPVWQAGEGQEDLRTQVDLPKTTDGEVVIWAAMTFEVVEMIRA